MNINTYITQQSFKIYYLSFQVFENYEFVWIMPKNKRLCTVRAQGKQLFIIWLTISKKILQYWISNSVGFTNALNTILTVKNEWMFNVVLN